MISDPVVVKTKGAPCKKKYGKQRRRCSQCKRTGHYKRRCPMLAQGDGLYSVDEEDSSSEIHVNHETFDNVSVFDLYYSKQ